MQTKNAIGNLKNRYVAVLKKCNLLNTFGSLAVVGMLTVGATIGGAVVGSTIEAALNVSAGSSFVSQAWAEVYKDSSGASIFVDDNTYVFKDSFTAPADTGGGTSLETTGDSTGTYYLNANGTTVDGRFILHSPSTILANTDNTSSGYNQLTINGVLSQTESGSDLSGIDVIINSGSTTSGYGGLALGNSLTVGNLTLTDQTYLSAYSADSGTINSVLLTIADDKTLTTTGDVAFITNNASGNAVSGNTITINSTGSATLSVSDSSSITIADDASVTIASSVALDNQGTIYIGASESDVSIATNKTAGALTLEGNRDLSSGNIDIIDGSLTVTGDLIAGNLENITGANSSSTDTTSVVIVEGTLKSTEDDLTIKNNVQYTVGAVELNSTTGTLSITGNSTSKENLLFTGLADADSFFNGSAIIVSGSDSTNVGDLTLGGDDNDTFITYGGTTSASVTIEENGDLHVDSGTWTIGELNVEASGSADIASSLTASNVDVSGDLNIDDGGFLTAESIDLNTSGSLTIDSGAGLTVNGTLTIADAATFENSALDDLDDGSHTVTVGNLDMSGVTDTSTVSLGEITIENTLTLGSSGYTVVSGDDINLKALDGGNITMGDGDIDFNDGTTGTAITIAKSDNQDLVGTEGYVLVSGTSSGEIAAGAVSFLSGMTSYDSTTQLDANSLALTEDNLDSGAFTIGGTNATTVSLAVDGSTDFFAGQNVTVSGTSGATLTFYSDGLSATTTGGITVGASGSLLIGSNTEEEVSGNVDLTIADLTISGGSATILDGSSLTLASNGTLEVGTSGSLINNGTLDITDAALVVESDAEEFTNTGSLTADASDFVSGSITLSGGSVSGSIVTNLGIELNNSGGILTLSNITIEGASGDALSLTEFDSIYGAFSGSISSAGTLIFDNMNVTVSENEGIADITGASVSVSGGIYVNASGSAGDTTSGSGTLVSSTIVSAGNLLGTANLTVQGTLTLTGDSGTNASGANIADGNYLAAGEIENSGGTVNLTGNTATLVGGLYTNTAGTTDATGVTFQSGYTHTDGTSTLTGSTVTGDLVVGDSSGSANEGAVNLSNSTVDGTLNIASNNTGLVSLNNSTVSDGVNLSGGTLVVTGTSNDISEVNTATGTTLQIASTDDDGAGVAGALEVADGTLAGTTLVGTSDVENSTGTLIVKDGATVSGVVFIDPAWIATGEHSTSYASKVAFEVAGSIDGAEIVAGRAAQLVIGTSDTSWVANAIDSVDDLTWGDGDDLISSAIGLATAIDISGSAVLIADGSLTSYADGSYTTADATQLYYNTNNGGTDDGGTALASGTAIFADNSLLIVDVEGTDATSSYALTATSLSVSDGASLLLTNVGTLTDGTTTVNVATADSSGSWAGWATDADSIYFENAFLEATDVANASGASVEVTVGVLDPTSVLPALDSSLGGLIKDAVIADKLPDFISNASKISDTKQAAATIEGAAKIAVSAGVMNTASNITGLGVNNIQNRTSLIATSSNSTLTANSGVLVASNDNYASDMFVAAVGDMAGLGGMKNGVGVWVQPMYQSTSADGFKSGNFKYGYDTDLYGVSVGTDYTFANSFRLGAALHMGTGDTESSSSDFNYTENDFDYFGFSLYGAYARDNFGLSADIGYTVTSNDVTQKTSVGNLYTGDFDASTFTAGVRAEYKVETSALDIIPHLGMRINYYDVDSFTTKDSAGDVYHSKSSDATTFSIPVGVSFSKDIETQNGVKVTPRADVGVQFTMGDLDVDQKVAISGVSGTATMESEIFDPVTFMGGVGIDVAKDNLSFALDYNLGASSNVTNHQVMATFTYKF